MYIRYIFSHNDQLGSRLISWGTWKFDSTVQSNISRDYVPSHVAVLLDNQFVIESTMLSGVRIIPYSAWKKINIELYSVPDINRTSEFVEDHLMSIWGKRYDWLGITFFALKLLFKRLPKENKWQNSKTFFCTEFAGRLSGKNYSSTTPAGLYLGLTR